MTFSGPWLEFGALLDFFFFFQNSKRKKVQIISTLQNPNTPVSAFLAPRLPSTPLVIPQGDVVRNKPLFVSPTSDHQNHYCVLVKVRQRSTMVLPDGRTYRGHWKVAHTEGMEALSPLPYAFLFGVFCLFVCLGLGFCCFGWGHCLLVVV
jgi:hypothetical protein